MIKFIKNLLYLIEAERNWNERTSDAPKVFKICKNESTRV